MLPIVIHLAKVILIAVLKINVVLTRRIDMAKSLLYLLYLISVLTFVAVFLSGILIGEHIGKHHEPEWVNDRDLSHDMIVPIPR